MRPQPRSANQGIELDFLIVFRLCRPSKSEMPSAPNRTASPSTTNGSVAVTERGFRNEGVAVAPIVAVTGEQIGQSHGSSVYAVRYTAKPSIATAQTTQARRGLANS